MEAETEKKGADTGYKVAQTADIRSLTGARAYAQARAERKEQDEIMQSMGRVKFGSAEGSFGRVPIYLRTEGGEPVRNRYTLGGGSGIIAPSVQASLRRGQAGLSSMSERVLSNYSAPLTINPLLRVGLPDVVGNRVQLNQRYVPGTQLPSGVAALSPNVSSNVINDLSVFKKKKPPY